MPILIKGYEMAPNCEDCILRFTSHGLFDTEHCVVTGENVGWFVHGDKGRPKSCPAVNVPLPHGRLIDLDEIEDASFRTLPTDMVSIYQRGWNDAIATVVEKASIIIDAEAEECFPDDPEVEISHVGYTEEQCGRDK